MKRSLFAILTIGAIGLSAPCLAGGPVDDCQNCKPGLLQRCAGFMPFHKCHGCGKMCGPFHKCGLLHHHHMRDNDLGYGGYGGPPTAQVTYPYYTVRGPRDFLEPVPPGGAPQRGIGP